ncbi:MAG: complex I subunit 4 family protein, partial [Actinomycetota bacterium]
MPWLTATTFLPIVGVVLLLVWPRIADDVARGVALVVSIATFLVSLGMLGRFDGSVGGFQMVERADWVQSLHLQYLLGVDGVSLFMVLLTTFLMPIALLASWRVERNVRGFMIAMLLLETAVVGTFLSLDLLLFFLFFEAMLFPMYLIIGAWGYERRIYAAVKFFLFTMFGSAFLLVAILFLYAKGGTFDVRQLTGLALSTTASRWLFLAFFIAFAVKVPIFPLHTWLPDAHTEAPTAGSVILAGVLLKMGTFGFFRYAMPLFPDAALRFRPAIATLAVIGIVYGALMSLVQKDMKRLVAYSSVAHLGFVVLGVFALTTQGIEGGVFAMISHGLTTGALFLLVGMLYDRRHTRQIAEFGGLWKSIPLLSGIFLFATFASIG